MTSPAGGPARPPAIDGAMLPRAILTALAAALLLLVWPGAAARAHAVLVESTPADGARLSAPPPEIVLRFSEPVSLIAASVLDGSGAAAAPADAASASDGTVRIPLPALPPGSYVASWRVTSADGHPVAGSLVFSVAAELVPPRLAASPDEGLLAVAAAANRAVHYGALLAAVGGILFVLQVLRRPHPLEARLAGPLCALLALAAATGALSVGLAGAQVAGLPLASLVSPEPWLGGMRTSLGGSMAAAIAGLFLIALGLALGRGRASVAVLLAGALLAVASLALSGHAATAPPRALSVAAVFLHGLAAAYWIGALAPLALVLLRLPLAEAQAIVRRFSNIALAAVAVLVAAGIALSILQIGDPAALVETDYGWIWLGKIGLVLVLLALAAGNRLLLMPKLAGSARPAAALRRSIAVELTVVAGILAATALLGQTPPPRALDAAGRVDQGLQAEHGHLHADPAAPVRARVTERGHAAAIELAPGTRGGNRLTVTLTDPEGRPLAAQEVTVALSLAEAGVEPFERVLAAAGEGAFAAEVEVPLAGRWTLRVDALVNDFEKLIFRTAVDIP